MTDMAAGPRSTIMPVFPSGAVMPPLSSASAHVINCQLKEIRPLGQSTFSYNGNSRITFDISSPSEFIDFSNSYLRFNLTCTLTNDGNNVTSKYLAEGGGQSMFSSITVETQSGTQIERIDGANRLAAIFRSFGTSKNVVDTGFLREVDSIDYKQIAINQRTVSLDLTGSTVGAGNISSYSGNFYADGVEVGDLVFVTDGAAPSSGVVTAINSATDIDVSGLSASAGATAGTLYTNNVFSNPARLAAANTADYTVCMQPFSYFLRSSRFFPLFLVRGGLRIHMDLERPEWVLASNEAPTGAGFANANYTIDSPVYVCQMIHPDQSLMQQYLDKFNSEGGVEIPFNVYRYRQSTFSGSGAHGFQNQANMRSARLCIIQQQDVRAQNVSTGNAAVGSSTYMVDSIAQGLKAFLTRLQLVSGSERYPLSGPMNLDSESNSEALMEAQRALNISGSNVLMTHRFLPEQYASYQSQVDYLQQGNANGLADESQRLYFIVRLYRDSSMFSGLNLSLSQLEVNLQYSAQYELPSFPSGRTGTASDRYINSWVMGDALLSISDKGVVVLS